MDKGKTAAEYAAEIVKHFPPGWTVTPDDSSKSFATLDGPDQVKLYLNTSHYDGKLALSGRYPHERVGDSSVGVREALPYNVAAPEIKVSIERDAQAVAKDIQRRLLPQVITLTATVRERVAQAQEFHNAREALVGKLAGIVGTEPGRIGSGLVRWGKLDVTVSTPTSVKIELSYVTADVAEAVLVLLAQHREALKY